MKSSVIINLDTYSCKLNVIVTDKIKSECNKIYNKYKLVREEQEDDDAGLVIFIDVEKYYLLIDIDYLTHNTIAHEIYHAAVRITEDRGISDEEAQAWLCGHLTEVTYKFLERKKLKVKHN